jgi:hypothetical protein
MNRYAFVIVLVLALVVAPASGLHAATIHGTLVNGTSGEKIDGVVKVINPGGGMMEETEVKAVDGSFTVEGLDPSASLYLLRSDHDGVMYTEVVRFEGQETAHATVTVYDRSPSFEGIHVLVPHLAAAAVEGELQIEVLYELHNHLEPAGTVADPDQQFLIYLPEDRINIMRSFVSHRDIPLDRFPVPTDEAGVYRIDYPIRPGDTEVGVAYSVPYRDSTYTLKYQVKQPIETMTIYTINSGMTVTSSTVKLGVGEAIHGMTAYEVSNLAAGTTLELTFRGGGPLEMAAAGGEDPHGGASAGTSVITMPNRMENPSTMLMVAVLLAMLAIVGMATRGPSGVGDQREHLQEFYETLLKRLARLDDLNEAGAVAHDVYKAKRAELKNQVASVLYQLQSGDKKKRRSARQPEPGTSGAGVAGNERTAQ